MMSFFDDIKRSVATGVKYGYYAVLFGGEAAYIDGITRVLSISEERMEFASEKRVIAVCGSGLSVSALEKESVIIKGHITGISEA